MAAARQPTNLILPFLSMATVAMMVLLPDWKKDLMALSYTNTPTIASVTVADNSFGLWGDDIAPEPDCYGSIGNCPGKQFIDNSNFSIPNGRSEWNSNTATASFSAQAFTTRHTSELRSQSQMAITAAMYYKPRFNVTVNIVGEGRWKLELDISRVASILIDERESGSSSRIDVSALSTSISGGTINTGSLSLGALPRYTTEGIYPVSQNNKAFIEGNGTASITFAMVYDINTRIHGATFANGDAVCWMSGQANQGADIACNPSPTAQQGLWLKGTLHVNVPPSTQADAYAVDTSGVFSLGNVLDNDNDTNGDTLQILGVDTSNTQGTVINNGDGTFDYDARAAFGYLAENETATDLFYYRATDGEAASEPTPVTIIVSGNRPAILPLDGIYTGSRIIEITNER